jgi:hypothetical protein
MKIIFRIAILLVICMFYEADIKAGDENSPIKYTISGYIKDAENGETLIGATIYAKELRVGAAANIYGFYSLSLAPGKYTIEYSFMGYTKQVRQIELNQNVAVSIELSPEVKVMQEVTVTAERPDKNVKQAEMSTARLDMKTIRQIPALMGEVDVIKAIQMLPGVQATSEGTSGFSVRGGGLDQNLIVLDEATVYNASHLMGFFSVFNNDAVRDVKLYKGDMPANYGGRLSSVLDVRMKEGNNKEFKGTGGVGLISSRLTLEGPIVNEKTSFLVSGRRTYADLFFPLFSDEDLKKSIMYFYDLNLKVNHQFNNNNRLYLSAYLGRDIFGQKGQSKAGFGNKTATLRWNHQFSQKLFSNLTAIASNYNYTLSTEQGGGKYVWNSNLLDYTVKSDFNFYPNPNNEIKFGVSATLHELDPIDAWIYTKESDTTMRFPSMKNYELEYSAYVANQQKVGEKITLKYGLRYTLFQNIGKSTLNNFDENHEYIGSTEYKKGEVFHSYPAWEPRLGIMYSINNVSSVKASYSRTYQFLQLASVSNGGMPLDYWFPSNKNVKPQKSDQFGIGYFRNFSNNKFETSIELFYKEMENVIDFKDHTSTLFNSRLEGDIRTGDAYSYGAEFLIRKNEGKLNGWVSYTLSRAMRKIPEINSGKEYSAPYDKPHNFNVVLNYNVSKRFIVSANWVFASGTPITFPVGSFEVDNTAIPIYSARNEYRMRNYHRLDLSATVKGKERPGRFWNGEWVFSVYNAYGRHNDWMLNFDLEKGIAERTYLPFVFFPAITYNFNF